jgi:hypothetical protein
MGVNQRLSATQRSRFNYLQEILQNERHHQRHLGATHSFGIYRMQGKSAPPSRQTVNFLVALVALVAIAKNPQRHHLSS